MRPTKSDSHCKRKYRSERRPKSGKIKMQLIGAMQLTGSLPMQLIGSLPRGTKLMGNVEEMRLRRGTADVRPRKPRAKNRRKL